MRAYLCGQSVSVGSIVVDLGSGIRLSCIVAAVEGDAQSFRKTCCCQSYHCSMKITGCIDMSVCMAVCMAGDADEWLAGGWQCSFSLAASFLAMRSSQQEGTNLLLYSNSISLLIPLAVKTTLYEP